MNRRGRVNSIDLDEVILVKQTLNYYSASMWTGFHWLRYATGDGSCEHNQLSMCQLSKKDCVMLC